MVHEASWMATGSSPLPDLTISANASRRLPDSLIENALDAGRDIRPDRARRADGWTPARIHTFLDTLAQCGVVAKAARAAGKSVQSAYTLRNSAKGRAFDTAWRIAQFIAFPSIPDELMERARYGYVRPIIRNGKVWGHRHRHDNRLAMAVLKRLDKQAALLDGLDGDARRARDEFDRFVDIVAEGDDARLGQFFHPRRETPPEKRQTSWPSTLPPADEAVEETCAPDAMDCEAAPGPDERKPSRSSTLPGGNRNSLVPHGGFGSESVRPRARRPAIMSATRGMRPSARAPPPGTKPPSHLRRIPDPPSRQAPAGRDAPACGRNLPFRVNSPSGSLTRKFQIAILRSK